MSSGDFVRIDFLLCNSNVLRKGECRVSFRRAGFFTVLVLAGVLFLAAGHAYCATAITGDFDHIKAVVPVEVAAGVGFDVSITFVDRNGNPMADGWKPERSLILQTSQPSSIQPPILTPQKYVPGFTYRVHTEKSGKIELWLRDEKGIVLDQRFLKIRSDRAVDRVAAGKKRSIDGITVKEDENRALVTFSTNGMTDFNVTTSVKLSRKWIDIEFPDILMDMPDRVDGGEKIVGEIYVEPSGGDGRGVKISVEILPTRIGYDVYLEGRSIVLQINRQ